MQQDLTVSGGVNMKGEYGGFQPNGHTLKLTGGTSNINAGFVGSLSDSSTGKVSILGQSTVIFEPDSTYALGQVFLRALVTIGDGTQANNGQVFFRNSGFSTFAMNATRITVNLNSTVAFDKSYGSSTLDLDASAGTNAYIDNYGTVTRTGAGESQSNVPILNETGGNGPGVVSVAQGAQTTAAVKLHLSNTSGGTQNLSLYNNGGAVNLVPGAGTLVPVLQVDNGYTQASGATSDNKGNLVVAGTFTLQGGTLDINQASMTVDTGNCNGGKTTVETGAGAAASVLNVSTQFKMTAGEFDTTTKCLHAKAKASFALTA
jgi:hypothetical protein